MLLLLEVVPAFALVVHGVHAVSPAALTFPDSHGKHSDVPV